jgi:hypothetical protein
MTRAERYEQIKPLREAGLMWREIGERLGISLKTAQDIYSDPLGQKRNRRQRESQARLRRPCPNCGGLMARSSESCRACEFAARKRARLARLEDVAAMYNEGLPIREIAQEIGYGPNSIPPEMTGARRLGLIGYRYDGWNERESSAA